MSAAADAAFSCPQGACTPSQTVVDPAKLGLAGVDLGQVLIALLAVLAFGVTTAVRDSATGIGLVLGLLFLFPLMSAVIPDHVLARHLEQIAPMTADYPPMTTTVNLPTYAALGMPYHGTVTVSGGRPPYTWEPVHGMPGGVTATPHGATLVLSGTVVDGYSDYPGGYVMDSESPPQEAGWQIQLAVGEPLITITDSGPDQATVGQPYSETYTASGGPGTPFTWSVQTPPWLKATVNGATVTVSGTPPSSELPASVTPERSVATVELTVTAGPSTAGRTIGIIIDPAS